MSQNQSKGAAISLLFISPAIGLYNGIKYLDWKNRKVIIVLFFIIYGSLLTYGEGADANRYMDLLTTYDTMTFSEFLLWLKHIITFDPLPGSPSDVYIHVLSFFTSAVLGMHGLFFPIVAAIYGYFYANAMSKILVWEKGFKMTVAIVLIIILFIIHRSVGNFQTVRSWTGMWILFNGVLGYHQTGKKKYIFLMMITPLIHFAYFLIAIPAFLALFIKKIPAKALIGLYFLSFFTTLNTSKVVNLSEDNSLAQTKVRSYYREDESGEGIDPIALREEKSNASWYAKYGKTDSVYYGGHAFAIFLIVGGYFKNKMSRLEIGLFGTGLCMAILANLGSFSYAFYSRSMANAVIYILGAVTLLALRGGLDFRNSKNPILLETLKWIAILLFFPKIIYFFADLLVMTSSLMLAMPFLGWFDEELNISIREAIQQFL